MAESFREQVMDRMLAEVDHPFSGIHEPEDREVLGRVYDDLTALDPPVRVRQVVEALGRHGVTHGEIRIIDALQKAINSR